MNKLSFSLLCGFLSITISSINAQKLPATQPTGIKAPANLKIDGNTNEWGNKFQAFNHSVDVFYTMANDNDNLYLVVKATDEVAVKKIFGGGIVLSITPAKNKYENGAGVGPLIAEAGRVAISNNYMQLKEAISRKAKTKQIDSLLLITNSNLAKASKEMIAAGIKGVDNTISAYNDLGFKSVLAFDRLGALNWELAIPLKYLKNATNSQPHFFYDLMIRGLAANSKPVTSKSGETVTVTDVPRSMATNNSSEMTLLMNSTDFWAEYVLVK